MHNISDHLHERRITPFDDIIFQATLQGVTVDDMQSCFISPDCLLEAIIRWVKVSSDRLTYVIQFSVHKTWLLGIRDCTLAPVPKRDKDIPSLNLPQISVTL